MWWKDPHKFEVCVRPRKRIFSPEGGPQFHELELAHLERLQSLLALQIKQQRLALSDAEEREARVSEVRWKCSLQAGGAPDWMIGHPAFPWLKSTGGE